MLVRYLVCLAGPDFVRNVGDIGEIDEREGRALLAKGFAEEVRAGGQPARSAKPERGVNPAVGRREKAVAE